VRLDHRLLARHVRKIGVIAQRQTKHLGRGAHQAVIHVPAQRQGRDQARARGQGGEQVSRQGVNPVFLLFQRCGKQVFINMNHRLAIRQKAVNAVGDVSKSLPRAYNLARFLILFPADGYRLWAAPPLVQLCRERRQRAGLRLARANRPNFHRVARAGLLPDQPAAGIDRVVKMRRKVNPVHALVILRLRFFLPPPVIE